MRYNTNYAGIDFHTVQLVNYRHYYLPCWCLGHTVLRN